MIALLLLVVSLPVTPYSEVHEQVDLIELNHFHDECGRPVYDQVIFYAWSHSQAKYHVRAWCLVEQRQIVERRPVHTYLNDMTNVRWFDADELVYRDLSSPLYRETFTQVDPERANKLIIDERNRTALIKQPDKQESPKVCPE